MRISLFLAVAALAVAAAANADNPIQTPYQQFGTANCSFAGDCAIVFPAVNKETLILHASCTFALTSTDNKTSIFGASLGNQNTNPRNNFAPSVIIASDGFANYAFNAETYLFYAVGDQPRIDVFGNSGPVQDLACTISGYYQS
jgi:hypothetical protein